jgi:hypothetical protein
MNPLELQVLAILSGNEEDAQRPLLMERSEPLPVLATPRDIGTAARVAKSRPRRARRGPAVRRAGIAR